MPLQKLSEKLPVFFLSGGQSRVSASLEFRAMLAQFESAVQPPTQLPPLRCMVAALAASGTPPSVWCATKDGSVVVLSSTNMEAQYCITTKGSFARSLAFIPPLAKNAQSEVWVGYTDGVIRLYCAESYEYIGCLGASTNVGGCVYSILFDGTVVYAGYGSGVTVAFAPSKKEVVSTFFGHTKAVRSLALVRRSGGKAALLATGSDDGTIRLWSGGGKTSASCGVGVCEATLEGCRDEGGVWALCSVAQSANEGQEASEFLWAGYESGAICVWNTDKRECRRLKSQPHPIIQLQCVGQHVVAIQYGNAVSLFDAATTKTAAAVTTAHDGPVRAIAKVTSYFCGSLCMFETGRRASLWHLRLPNVKRIANERAIVERHHAEEKARLLQLIERHTQRLNDRLHPPSEAWLQQTESHCKQTERRLIRAVANQAIASPRLKAHCLSLAYFKKWEMLAIRHHASSVRQLSMRLACRADVVLLKRYAKRWIRRGAALALQSRNSRIVAHTRFEVWQRWRLARGAIAKIRLMQIDPATILQAIRVRYWKRWRAWSSLQSVHRKQAALARTFLTQTSRGLSSVYYSMWKQYVASRRRLRIKGRVMDVLAGRSTRVLRTVTFRRWKNSLEVLRRVRTRKLALDVMARLSSRNLRQLYFTKWQTFRQRRSKSVLYARLYPLLLRATTQGMLRLYYRTWRSCVRVHRYLRKSSSFHVMSFASSLSSNNLLRGTFRKWCEYVGEHKSIRRQRRAAHNMLRSTETGLMRLTFTRFVQWYKVKKETARKNDLRRRFLRGFSRGLNSIYFHKWQRFLHDRRKRHQRRLLGDIMTTFSSAAHRSKYFHHWFYVVLVRRKLQTLLHKNYRNATETMKVYLQRWLRHSFERVMQRSRHQQLAINAHVLEVNHLRQRYDTVSGEMNTARDLCQQLIAAHTSMEAVYSEMVDESQSLDTQLRTANLQIRDRTAALYCRDCKLERVRTALMTRTTNPTEVLVSWHHAWTNADRLCRSIQNEVSTRKHTSAEWNTKISELVELCNKAKGDVQEVEKQLAQSISPFRDDGPPARDAVLPHECKR